MEEMTASFMIVGALTIAGAVAAMGMRNLVHCILALVLAFAGFAVLFMLLGAQFVGLAQVLIYVGAVAILAVFAIMLTRGAGKPAAFSYSSFWGVGGAVAVAVFALLAWTIHSSGVSRQALLPQPGAPVKQIGDALMRQFVLPLEIVGLLLTAALIGAVVVAMQEKKETR
jgi:NADH-quinone oxidoreductase subunit J